MQHIHTVILTLTWPFTTVKKIVADFSRLPSVSDDMAAADVEDISASEDQVVDVSQTGAASFESDKFAAGSDRLADMGDNTDDDADDDDDEDDDIFQPLEMTAGSEMVSSVVTASNEYSGIDVGLAADSTLSPSCSYDALLNVSQQEQRPSSLPSSVDESEDPLARVVELQDDETAENPAAVRQGDIGSLTDRDESPVVFLARMLCSEFLLTGYVCGLLPDRQVRVSVKALALSCMGYLVDLCPQLIVMNLHKTSPEPGSISVF